ncbi:unnamed protein product [marine sediment metagenome]|uniref:Uncharacterized protein n=1 Tax=marine sediment metagenome TaxID=412755 RepID=X1A0K4_9ZZZZ
MEDIVKISKNRHRYWIWCDASAIVSANNAIRTINNGDAWSVDKAKYEEGDLCGWSMTKTMYTSVLDALTPFISAGTVKMYQDTYGNIDDEGEEKVTTRFTQAQVVNDKKATRIEEEE